MLSSIQVPKIRLSYTFAADLTMPHNGKIVAYGYNLRKLGVIAWDTEIFQSIQKTLRSHNYPWPLTFSDGTPSESYQAKAVISSTAIKVQVESLIVENDGDNGRLHRWHEE